MAAIEEEKQETSFIEKLMFVLLPFLFVAVLIVVLLTLLDVNFRNDAIKVGQGIPFVKNFLPEPAIEGSASDDGVRTDKQNTKIDELQAEIDALQSQLAEATTTRTTQETTISSLQLENDELKQDAESNKLSDEEYSARIQELASMFSRMQPSKAAPIVQAMTLEEMTLIFSAMRADDRVRIMEKMNPQTAADVTLMLKDQDSVQNLETAALQAQIKKLQGTPEATTSSTQVTDAELANTFSSMEPKAASDMLLKMMDISSSKVLRILKATDNATRSAILEQMSATDEQTSALLVTRLMQDS